MSNKFLKALARVKLVELDASEAEQLASDEDDVRLDEIDKLLAEEQEAPPPRKAAPAVPPSSAASAAPAANGGNGDIPEGQPFEEFYAQASVPPAPYTAEKLLRVLDGLKAMDPHTRKAAVLAMDAADEEWSIADAVMDAQRKTRVLHDTVADFEARLAALRDHATQEKATRDSYLTEATKTIKQKIQELEETLQRETAEITAQKAQIDGRVQAAEAACRREAVRMKSEIERLSQIPSTFAIERPKSE